MYSEGTKITINNQFLSSYKVSINWFAHLWHVYMVKATRRCDTVRNPFNQKLQTEQKFSDITRLKYRNAGLIE